MAKALKYLIICKGWRKRERSRKQPGLFTLGTPSAWEKSSLKVAFKSRRSYFPMDFPSLAGLIRARGFLPARPSRLESGFLLSRLAARLKAPSGRFHPPSAFRPGRRPGGGKAAALSRVLAGRAWTEACPFGRGQGLLRLRAWICRDRKAP